MLRRPPRSTLFPSRRSSDLEHHHHAIVDVQVGVARELGGDDGPGHRSEEHTSELQSLTNLVCRLLLEKKKKNSFTLNAYKTRRNAVLPCSLDTRTARYEASY